MTTSLRQRLMIPRPRAARLLRIFPWVMAPLAGGLALATAAFGTIAAIDGRALIAAVDGASFAVNLVIVFVMGMRIGEQRVIAAGAPHVIIEFSAADGSIQVTGGPIDLPPGDPPATRH
jgi:hypothetical protein